MSRCFFGLFDALIGFSLINNLLLPISAFVNLLFLSVTGPLSELQIAYVCRETLQVMNCFRAPKPFFGLSWDLKLGGGERSTVHTPISYCSVLIESKQVGILPVSLKCL